MQSIQNGYILQPLSSFNGLEPKTTSEDINWINYDVADLKNINFFKYANFMLNYTIPNLNDQTMLASFGHLNWG